MRHLLRCLVLVACVAATLVPVPAKAVASSLVHGEPLIEDCEPGCPVEGPDVFLATLTYQAQTNAINLASFNYIPGKSESVCLGTGPGSCGFIGVPDLFVFADANAAATSTGLCTTRASRTSVCQTPASLDFATPIPNAVDPLPVDVNLGARDDVFEAVMVPLVQEFSFSVNLGDGNDRIVLVDNTGATTGAVDRVSCGTGVDSVTTNLETVVSPDCESVQRLT